MNGWKKFWAGVALATIPFIMAWGANNVRISKLEECHREYKEKVEQNRESSIRLEEKVDQLLKNDAVQTQKLDAIEAKLK